MKKNLKILFTGGKGFIGREIIPLFRKDGYEVVDPSSKELNLLDSDAVKKFIENDNFDIIGDFDLFLRLSENNKIGYMHDVLAVYRLHKSNLSKKKIEQHVFELQTWVQANEDKAKYKGNLKYIKFYLFKLKLKNFLYKFLGM